MNDDYLAYFRFEGKKVKEGYLDTRKSAEALLGIDDCLRFFIGEQAPDMMLHDFEIPVKIRKGSWEALIPQNIVEWLITIGGLAGTKYLLTAAGKLAKNDIGEKGLKDIFKTSIKAIKWCIEIAKHQKTTIKRKFDGVKFKEIQGVTFVGIANSDGDILYVPKKYVDLFAKLPANIFSKIASVVDDERVLKVDFSKQEATDVDDFKGYASISTYDKEIFIKTQDDEILFPELVHGKFVKLEGYVTRGNKNSNNIGFEYKNHILTCYPISGNIIKDKSKLFSECRITGVIDRIDKSGYIEKRPKIRYSKLQPLNSQTQDLFET